MSRVILTATPSKAARFSYEAAHKTQAAIEHAGHGAVSIEYDGADMFVLMLGEAWQAGAAPVFVQSVKLTVGNVFAAHCARYWSNTWRARDEVRLHAWRLWRARSEA